MPVRFTDNFDRANGPLAAPWADIAHGANAATIVDNVLRFAFGSGVNYYTYGVLTETEPGVAVEVEHDWDPALSNYSAYVALATPDPTGSDVSAWKFEAVCYLDTNPEGDGGAILSVSNAEGYYDPAEGRYYDYAETEVLPALRAVGGGTIRVEWLEGNTARATFSLGAAGTHVLEVAIPGAVVAPTHAIVRTTTRAFVSSHEIAVQSFTVEGPVPEPPTDPTWIAPVAEPRPQSPIACSWTASTDPEGGAITYDVQAAIGNGTVWEAWADVVTDQAGTTCTWRAQTYRLRPYAKLRVRATASGGLQSAWVESETFRPSMIRARV